MSKLLTLVCLAVALQGCDPGETLLDPFPFFTATRSGAWGDDCAAPPSRSSPALAPPKGDVTVCGYPNPVSPGQMFTVSFYVPAQTRVRIAIFDDRGKRVKEIFNDVITGDGSATWDVTDSQNRRVSPGSYRGFLVAGDFESHGDIIVK